jgi:3-hydroxyacyl-CoA dehydrogenase
MGAKPTVAYEARGKIALLTIDNPPVNLLSAGVREALSAGFARAQSDEAIEIIVITGAGRAFIAGADISEFGVESAAPSLDEVFRLVEACTKPVVAAVNGVALGGGLELALCCDYRVASRKAALGLPEVKLGLLPGGGGTQRLPRLVGPVAALDLILSGETVATEDAVQLGLVERIIEGPLVEGALAHARTLLDERAPSRKIRDHDALLAPVSGERDLFVAAYQRAAQRMPNRFALEMIVECVAAAVNEVDFDAGLAIERSCFRRCVEHSQHAALKHLFLAERGCGKIPVAGAGAPRPVARALVIAAPETEALAVRLASARVELCTHESLAVAVEHETLDAIDLLVAPVGGEELTAIANRLQPAATLALVLGEDARMLAEQVAGLERPGAVVGLKVAPSGRVLEVLRGEATDDDALLTIMGLAKRMRMIAVCCKLDACSATIGDRIVAAARRELDAILDPMDEPTVTDDAVAQLDEALLDRYLQAWSDEAQRIVDAGLVLRPGDLDVLCVHGYGFPELLGGPLHWASHRASAGTT